MRQACFLTMELQSNSECVANGRRREEREREREIHRHTQMGVGRLLLRQL